MNDDALIPMIAGCVFFIICALLFILFVAPEIYLFTLMMLGALYVVGKVLLFLIDFGAEVYNRVR